MVDRRIEETLKALDEASKREDARIVKVHPDKMMSAITWDTGMFFNMLLRTANAKNVLEIGMSTGFSAIWLAEAVMGRGGKIITIEQNQEKVSRARANFERAGVMEFVDVRKGVASDVLGQMASLSEFKSRFDFVLIDADKENVSLYFEMVLPMTRKGGIIATDNMIHPKWFSPIMEKFAGMLRQNASVRTVTLPVGHGVEITTKM